VATGEMVKNAVQDLSVLLKNDDENDLLRKGENRGNSFVLGWVGNPRENQGYSCVLGCAGEKGYSRVLGCAGEKGYSRVLGCAGEKRYSCVLGCAGNLNVHRMVILPECDGERLVGDGTGEWSGQNA